MSRKKVNPRRRPASVADVRKAGKLAQEETLTMVVAIVLSGLLDRGLLEPEQIPEAWDAINSKADSVRLGYCSVADLAGALREEYGIFV